MPEQFFSINTHLHFIVAPHILFAFQNKSCLNIGIFQLIKLSPYIFPYISQNSSFFHIHEVSGILLHRHEILGY